MTDIVPSGKILTDEEASLRDLRSEASYLEKYGFHYPDENYVFRSRPGLDAQIVAEISHIKGEPAWMLELRLKSLKEFERRPMPAWGGDLSGIKFDEIYYYVRATEKGTGDWNEVPDDIKETFDRLGIPEAERQFLAGAGAQYESEMVYHKVQEHLEKQGVIFLSMDDGLRQHPELVKEYFGSVIPYTDNKFAALNTAVWSGGSFIYVPKGVHIEMPLQAYFRINTESMGQFERTLIIVDEGASVHYVEGCTAPIYSKDSLHSAVVEIIVKKGGKCRYTTIQNWSNNVYNLVTKRAVAYADATMEWVDANLGCLHSDSKLTTPDGIKTIQEVEVGDQVLSYDEKEGKLVFRKVTAKRYSGEQPVHTISVGERKLRATANHPFYSYTYNPDAPRKSGRYQLSYVRADQLQQVILPRTSIDYGVPYRLIKPVLTTTFESFNQYASNLTMSRTQAGRLTNVEYTTDDIMWMFGYWMGDGNIQVKEGKTEGVTRWAKVGFSTPRTDRARPQLMKVMGEIIEAEPTERVDGVHLAWNSKELAEFFRLNGFYGKATDKRVPEWVWSLPESQRLAFIAGYLDADGTMQVNQFCAKSVNRALLEDMASLLVTLGITPRLHTEFSEPKTVMIMGYECVAHGSHRLDFRVDERFFPYLSSSLRERAAQSTAQKQLVLGRHIGRSSIELGDDVEVATVKVSEASAEPVPTWDIEVEDTGNFVSEGFIVHNSHLTMKYPAVHM
ncbi:MAG: Fe-S cluster assembly protein SufB, partial [Anaerolineae bacterium]|nr:Fe-S cluster assembly protein SufB [Anaerolineae bacterium]